MMKSHHRNRRLITLVPIPSTIGKFICKTSFRVCSITDPSHHSNYPYCYGHWHSSYINMAS